MTQKRVIPGGGLLGLGFGVECRVWVHVFQWKTDTFTCSGQALIETLINCKSKNDVNLKICHIRYKRAVSYSTLVCKYVMTGLVSLS